MPPEQSNGLQMFRGVIFLRPDEFIEIVNEFVEESLSTSLPEALDNSQADDASSAAPSDASEMSIFQAVRRVLEGLGDQAD